MDGCYNSCLSFFVLASCLWLIAYALQGKRSLFFKKFTFLAGLLAMRIYGICDTACGSSLKDSKKYEKPSGVLGYNNSSEGGQDMQNESIENIVSVIAYIEANLTEKLDLNRVANAVHYSKYHLHRMFTGTVGLTLHDYLQRRQLTEAAKLLVFSNKSILDIALLAGYESQQAFTNVFTAMYKMPPSKYRENEKFYPLQLKFHLEGNFNMLNLKEQMQWEIEFATEDDIPCWMDLVRLVINGFPFLNEDEYMPVSYTHLDVYKRQDLTGARVLLAEDNEINAEIVTVILEKIGAQVEQVPNGKAAVDLFEVSPEGTYILILMDIQMPVMDGLEATRRIRKMNCPHAKTIPIIGLSANAFSEDIDRALRSGMTGYLSKPIEVAKLLETIRQFL